MRRSLVGVSARIGFLLAGLVVIAAAGRLLVSPAGATHITGASYTGTHSGGGTVDFTVSADGTRVSPFRITNLRGNTCGINVRETPGGAVSGHAFSFEDRVPGFLVVSVSGSFSGTQSANGTLQIVARPPSETCSSPTMTWTATTTARPPSPPPPPPPPPVAQPARCIVPNVKGRSIVAARAALTRARCKLGRVARAYSVRRKKGRVISQRPAPGVRRPNGARVNVVVGRGPRP